MLGIGKEAAVFLDAFLAGFFVWGMYTAVRIFRRIIRHNLFFVGLEDMVYWIAMAFFLFLQMYETSDGSIRWYFVLGTAIGVCVSAVGMQCLVRFCRKIGQYFSGKIGKGVD